MALGSSLGFGGLEEVRKMFEKSILECASFCTVMALGIDRSNLVARDFDLGSTSVTCSVCRLHDRCRGALQERVVTWGIGDGKYRV